MQFVQSMYDTIGKVAQNVNIDPEISLDMKVGFIFNDSNQLLSNLLPARRN